MRTPILINASDAGTYQEPQSITCTDSAWLAVLNGARFTLDVFGEFDQGAAAGSPLFAEIARFTFDDGTIVSVELSAAGTKVVNQTDPGKPFEILRADLSEIWQLTRIEFNDRSMRCSMWQWPKWEPICQGVAGAWVDCSAVWPAAAAVVSLSLGATSETLLVPAAPMWTVYDIVLAPGVLPGT